MRLIGFDPGLKNTGWGVIEHAGTRLRYVADGVVSSDPKADLATRLVQLHDGLVEVIRDMAPAEAAVEETFVNTNPTTTLKLGQARGISMLVPALAGISVFEYTPNLVKKTVVGTGHAAKEQVQMMIRTLLPGTNFQSADSADALAVAICHAHNRTAPGAAAGPAIAGGAR